MDVATCRHPAHHGSFCFSDWVQLDVVGLVLGSMNMFFSILS